MGTFDPRERRNVHAIEAAKKPAAKVSKADFESNLLRFIGKHEAPRGYDQMYSGSKIRPPKPITQMTINEVLAYQDRSVAAGSASSAAGQYQFIRKTLRATVAKAGVSGNELFDNAMQDKLAGQLLRNRGLKSFQSGKISAEQFGNNLAKEWASLPVMTGPKRGRSHYAGDGLNNALTNVGEFGAVLTGKRYVPSTKGARTRPLGFSSSIPSSTSREGRDLLASFAHSRLTLGTPVQKLDQNEELLGQAILDQHNENVEQIKQGLTLAVDAVEPLDLDVLDG